MMVLAESPLVIDAKTSRSVRERAQGLDDYGS
jgi:hypothetical protein